MTYTATKFTDKEMLDFLDKNANINFSFETASIEVRIPDDLDGVNSARELIIASIKMGAL